MSDTENKKGQATLLGGAPESSENAPETPKIPDEANSTVGDKKDAEEPVLAPRTIISQDMADHLASEQLEMAQRAMLPTEKILAVMTKFAQYCVQTGQMPSTIDTAAKAIITFQAGRELGIPPMKSLYSFYFVNNKLTMYGPTVIERIRMWAKIEYGLCNAEQAEVTITRKDDGTSLSNTVTMKELKERGLTDGKYGMKDTFKKHAKTMLLYKAVGEIVRHIVPEAVGAMAVEGDEYGREAEQQTPARRGAVVTDVVPVEPEEKSEVPTVSYMVSHYDRDTLYERCIELKLQVDPKATKKVLAEAIRDHLINLSIMDGVV